MHLPGRVRLQARGRGAGRRQHQRAHCPSRCLQYDYGRPPQIRAHREALRALHAAYLAQTSSYYYSSADVPIHLDELGPSLWPLLAQATQTGLELVPVKDSLGTVTLAGPASISLDLRRGSPAADATLEPVVTIDGAAYSAAAGEFLGDPLHGLFLDTDAGLLLAPLDERPSKQVARLVCDATRLAIPATELDRFLGPTSRRCAKPSPSRPRTRPSPCRRCCSHGWRWP